MILWNSLVLIFAGSSVLSAEPTQQVEERSIAAGGGWALNVSPCPQGSAVCGVGCCPTALTCTAGIGNAICCPGNTQCLTALEATPVCADNTWTLWEGQAGLGNFFCCEDDLKGDNTGDCVSNKTFLAPSVRAVSLLPSHTAAVSGAAASSTVPSSMAAASTSATPTGIGTSSAGGNIQWPSLTAVITWLFAAWFL